MKKKKGRHIPLGKKKKPERTGGKVVLTWKKRQRDNYAKGKK